MIDDRNVNEKRASASHLSRRRNVHLSEQVDKSGYTLSRFPRRLRAGCTTPVPFRSFFAPPRLSLPSVLLLLRSVRRLFLLYSGCVHKPRALPLSAVVLTITTTSAIGIGGSRCSQQQQQQRRRQPTLGQSHPLACRRQCRS